MCGAFGQRDFNSWNLAEGCTAVLPIVLGPLFTFGVAYGAAWFVRSGRSTSAAGNTRALLLLASTTLLGRVAPAMLGGGDELLGLRRVLPINLQPHAQMLTVVLLLALSLWPAIVAYRALQGRLLVFLAWAVLPFILLALFVLFGLNSLLSVESLASPLILGSPPVVHVYTVALLMLAPFAWMALRKRA